MRRVRLALTTVFLISSAHAVWADQTAAAAYRAILNGDYQNGEQTLARLATGEHASDPALRAKQWVDSYLKIADQRKDLLRNTFDWNMDHARQALKDGKTYVALSFTAQAERYAADADAFAEDPWVRDLREVALSDAKGYLDQEKWARAHAHYTLLLRINENDTDVEKLRDITARHLRLQFLYKNDEDIKRRLKGVRYDMLTQVIQLVNDTYYDTPDFRAMAEGAIDNFTALCHTTKLYDASSVFDGIADPLAREHFMSKLQELRRDVESRDSYDHRQLLALYKELKRLNASTVSLPEPMLIVEFVEGALGRLDQFTSIVWPADSPDFDKLMMGKFKGVGIQLGADEINNRLKVVTPLENSPALRAGIQPDDLILAVDGVSTADWDSDRAVREITGKEGTMVNLTMYRPRTGKKWVVPLKRSPIRITTIRGVDRIESENGDKWNYMLDDKADIAYIKLTGFSEKSHEELSTALADAKSQGMKGLILDLRNNPGGLLDVAIEIVSNFLEEGEVVWTKGRAERRQDHPVTGDVNYGQLPLVILINEGSASASEILSGALLDHHRALIVGNRSFGKGSVQRVLGLNRSSWFGGGSRSGGRLKVTTALYHLPSNRSPHKIPGAKIWGVDPNLSVKLSPKEFVKVLEHERAAYIIHNEDDSKNELSEEERIKRLRALKADDDQNADDEDDTPPLLSDDDIALLRSDKLEAPDTDPQLETALLQLRIKLLANVPWPMQLAQNATAATKDDKP